MKKAYRVICILTILALSMIFSSCQKKQSDDVKNTIVWCVSDQMIDVEGDYFIANLEYFNSLLKADGYDFCLEFRVISGNPSDYQEKLAKEMKTEDYDIVWLGSDFIDNGGKYSAQKIVDEGLTASLNEFLESEEGAALKAAYRTEEWEAVSDKSGNIYSIPSQALINSFGYVAFNNKYFSDVSGFDGNLLNLSFFVKNTSLPEGVKGYYYYANILGSLGCQSQGGVLLDVNEGKAVSYYECEPLHQLYKDFNAMYNDGSLDTMSVDKAFNFVSNPDTDSVAFIIASDYGNLYDALVDDYTFVQLPFMFLRRVTASTAISKTSDSYTDACRLLTLLYTDEKYANALIYGDPDEMYTMKDGYVDSGIYFEGKPYTWPKSLATGVADMLYPSKANYVSHNVKELKDMWYGSEKIIANPFLNVAFDLSEVSAETSALDAINEEYSSIWKSKDFDAEWEKARSRALAAGSEKVCEKIMEQIR